MTAPGFLNISIREPTRALLDECVAATPPDDLGRQARVCEVIHRALELYRENMPPLGAPGVARRITKKNIGPQC